MRTPHRRRLATLASTAFAVLGFAGVVFSAEFPDRPVRIVSATVAGGMSDIYARILGADFSKLWSQPVTIENRPGAGGYIGTDYVAKAKADGYTLLMGTITTNALTPFLFKAPAYDAAKDFVPVALVAEAEGVAIVNPSIPVHSFPELIDYARKNSIVIGSGGIGTASHLSAELFKTMTGMKQLEIAHYRGMAPMVNDVVAGHVPFAFANMQTAISLINTGRLRALAVVGTTRSVTLPDLPTVSEVSLPGYSVSNWIGLFAPAGTPPDVVKRVNAEVVRLMQTPEIQTRLKNDGGRFKPNTPEEFAAFVAEEAKKWGPIVTAAGIKLE